MRFIYTKAFGFFALSLSLVCVLVFLNYIDWLYPIEKVFLNSPAPIVNLSKKVVKPIKDFASTIFQLHKITLENEELQNKVMGLQQDLINFDQEKKENEALRNELGFIKNSKLKLVPCSVLSQNIFGSPDIIVLNCGKDKGVIEGEAIISQGYLVGKIVYVSKDTSSALLSISSQFSTDAKISKTGADGVVKGSFGSGMILDQLSQNINIEKGSLIISGGINDKIPKNILIGETGEEISNPNDLFKKTTLLNPINFNDIGFVFVVQP